MNHSLRAVWSAFMCSRCVYPQPFRVRLGEEFDAFARCWTTPVKADRTRCCTSAGVKRATTRSV